MLEMCSLGAKASNSLLRTRDAPKVERSIFATKTLS